MASNRVEGDRFKLFSESYGFSVRIIVQKLIYNNAVMRFELILILNLTLNGGSHKFCGMI